MSSFILKYLMNRVLRDNQLNRLGVEDPYYEHIPIDAGSNGVVKYKKIKRRVPDGLTKNDESVLQQVRVKAYRYDMWFSFIGVKFGFTNIIGLIPVVGSIVSTYWSLTILYVARKLDDGLPLDLQLLFLLNIGVDFVLGLIPIVGDLIEVGYKANLRNFLLLERHLARVGEKNRGLIKEEDVRPGFINDKVQPFVEDNVKPAALKAGEQVKSLLHKSNSSSSANSADSRIHSLAATTQTYLTSVTSVSSTPKDSTSATIEKIKNST